MMTSTEKAKVKQELFFQTALFWFNVQRGKTKSLWEEADK